MDLSRCESFYIFEVLYQCMCLLSFLKWGSIGYPLGIVQWDFTRRDHPGNPGRVSGSGPVINVGKRLNGYTTSSRIFESFQSLCLQYAYIVIVNFLLVEHKVICIRVSLDIFVVDTTPLENYSQLGFSP